MGSDRNRGLERLVELSREALGEELSSSEQAGLARLERSLAPRVPRGFGWRWPLLACATAAAAVAVVVGAGKLHPHGSALTFRVEGGTVSDSGYLFPRDANGAVAVHFSEGTAFELAAGSRARVTGVDAEGARMLIESGAARVHVTPRPRARWSVDAGPYTIRVTGTAFDVAWSGRDEVLDLSLHHGSVVVTGPLAAQGLVLEPGQHLAANVKAGVIRLDRTRTAAAVPARPVEGSTQGAAPGPLADEAMAPAEAPDPNRLGVAAARAHRTAAPPKRAAPTSQWAARLAHGEFQAIVADAERRGIDETLRTTTGEDLAALADAARYARRNGLAEQALLAERRRFPDTVPGRDAAFFLGGLAEQATGKDAAAAALSWYDRYLRETPDGTYVAQALGHRMAMTERLGERAEARAAAAEYLRRYPRGPYAARARTLLEP
jgi:ferric-dicitrate binding protein FerR (iron transport regulator)